MKLKLEDVKMTAYSHGAGWGCKLSPELLENILSNVKTDKSFEQLLVGNKSNDDAAAFDIGNDQVILSTTDFFMPIVDDPYTFGRIAATNSISDIYAMGGKPLMAIAIFGWPIDKLPAEVGSEVIKGGRDTCLAAGIPLAGGHSIDSPEPIFGLAVTGIVNKAQLKYNDRASDDCFLYLTKPLGIGILTTAQKRGKIENDDLESAVEAMCTLNSIGERIADLEGIEAMTDITGFGLIGHLSEMCQGSDISAIIDAHIVPKLPRVDYYIESGCIPGGTIKNYNSYAHNINEVSEPVRHLLCDAQTSGGLLIAVNKKYANKFESSVKDMGYDLKPIGYTTSRSDLLIRIREWYNFH